MVHITRVYTRGGDKGKASLGDRTRRAKSDIRFEAIGSVDEANAALGVAITEVPEKERELLRRIQNDLFDLGADLAIPKGETVRVSATQVEFLEKKIDELNASLAPLNSFVLPGGSKAAAWLHMARVIVRRAERAIVKLNESEPLNPEILRYVNRLSDLAFVLSRRANANGCSDILWNPGENS